MLQDELDEELDEDELDIDEDDEDLDDEEVDEDDEDLDDEDSDEEKKSEDKKSDGDQDKYKKAFIKERKMRKRYQERYKQAAKTETPKKETPKTPAKEKEDDGPDMEQRLDFRMDNPHLKSREVDYVVRLSKAYNLSMKAAAKLPEAKFYLEKVAKKRKILQASASKSEGAGTSRKSQPDFANMSDAEFDEWEKNRR